MVLQIRLVSLCKVILLLMLYSHGCSMGVNAGKVLGLFHVPAPSHFVMYEKLMRELASRGHEVTVVSHFPLKTPVANYTDVSVLGSIPLLGGSLTVEELLNFDEMNFLFTTNVEICDKVLNHPNVQKLIQSQEHYDVVILQIFGVDCFYGVAWKLGAPVIGMTTLARMPGTQFRVGNPENPAYFPLAYTPFSSRMTFWQRFHNTMKLIYMSLLDRLKAAPAIDKINRKLFGPEIPPLEDLLYNTSVIIINSHFSLNGALPAVPAVVEVGGLHVSTTRRQLPKDLQSWLDGAEKGVVYVSFGSLARAEDMSLRQLDAMERVLRSLAQRVVWKCDGEKVARRLGRELSRNIFTATWMPQADILASEKVIAFVSHGGLMGTQEAVYWGKPVVTVPFFADQFQNARNLVERGVAVELHFNDIDEKSFQEALHTIIHDRRYMENARRLSTLFRDRPRSATEEAVYWVEYVMRHKGAPHMRSAAADLWWWQLWLLDVVMVFVAPIVLSLIVSIHCCRHCRFCTQKEKTS